MTAALSNSHPPVVDTTAAAAYIGVSPRTLHTWRSEGRGPSYIRAGRCIRYRLRDLETYLDARTVEAEG